MRLLACGDLHLGASVATLGPDRLAEQEAVWRRCLEIGREHEVDAVLFAADAWERRKPTPDEILAFERPLIEHLRVDGAGVLAIPGNHDLSSLEAGCGLDILAEAGFTKADVLRLARRPAVIQLPAPGQPNTVSVACLPWAPVARLVASTNGIDRPQIFQLAAEALIETARGLRAQVDGPCVLLSHFAVEGFATPAGIGTELFPEPVLPWHELQTIGFDWMVFGHVHRPAERDNFIYVGSPLPLNHGEGSCDHGVWILDTDTGFTFLPVESRGFLTIDIDVTACIDADPTETLIAEAV